MDSALVSKHRKDLLSVSSLDSAKKCAASASCFVRLFRRHRLAACVWILSGLAIWTQASPIPQHFYPDDPVWIDPDDVSPVRDAQRFQNSEMFDFFRNRLEGEKKPTEP